MKCKNPKEMEVKLIEMQEKNAKLEKELRESMELHKKNEDLLMKQLGEANKLKTKNEDLLRKELKDAKELQKKNEDALKKNIYGLNQSLFDKKREFHLFKTTCGEIRNKLKKEKENLSKCPNVNPRDLM